MRLLLLRRTVANAGDVSVNDAADVDTVNMVNAVGAV